MGVALVAVAAVTAGAVVWSSARAAASPDLPVQVPTAAYEQLPDSAEVDGPTLLSGQVSWPTGRPAGPVEVLAQAWPDEATMATMAEGTTFNLLPVARGHADRNGTFRLRVDPDALPVTYVSDHGQVDLTVTAWDGVHVGEHNVSVTGVTVDGRDRFVDPLGLDVLVNDPAASRGASGRLQTREASSPVGTLSPVQVAFTADQPQASVDRSTIDKPWTECNMTLVQRGLYRNAWVGDGLPADSGQTSSFLFQNSQTVTLETAYDVSNDSVGYKRGGTLSRNSSFSQDFAKSSARRYYRVNTEQGRYEGKCYLVSGGSKSYLYDKKELRTILLTGGTSVESTSYNPGWSYCQNIAAGTWTRASSSYSAYNNSVGLRVAGLIGINLTSTSQYDTSNVLRLHQSNANYQACGDNDEPSQASRIKGKRR